MREVDPAVMAALQPVREIAARAFIENLLPVFTERDTLAQDAVGADGSLVHDAHLYGSGILRIAVSGGTLRYQYAPSPPADPWPDWVNSGIAVKAGSKPGLHLGRLFYQGADGGLYYRDFGGAGFGAAAAIPLAVDERALVALAPVGQGELYVLEHTPPAGGYARGRITYTTTGGAASVWDGAVYSDAGWDRTFDAERAGNADYVYFSEQGERRPMVLSRAYGTWSLQPAQAWGTPRPLVPLDLTTETTRFRLGGAAYINGEVVASGILGRDSGPSLQVYTFGPERATLGRELYIGAQGVEGRTYTSGEATYRCEALGGKLLLAGGTLFYLGLGVCYHAPATKLFGESRPTLIAELNNIQVSYERSQPGRLTAEAPAAPDLGGFLAGSELALEMGYGGQFARIGTFGVDALPRSESAAGAGQAIVGRTSALRRLAQWQSDASYDLRSQAVELYSFWGQIGLVRGAGQWNESDGAYLEELNRDGWLYSPESPARNRLAKGLFRYPSDPTGRFAPSYGIAVNYYRESRLEAAGRLGKAPEEVADGEFGHYGFVMVYGTGEHDGGPGLALYLSPGTHERADWLKLASFAKSIPPDTDHLLGLEYYEGHLRLLYKAAAEGDWAVVGTHDYSHVLHLPWYKDGVGRTAVYMRNGTPEVGHYGFDAAAPVIPLESAGALPEADTLLVGAELVSYSGKSAAIHNAGSGNVLTDSYILKNPDGSIPWDNPYQGPYSGYPVWVSGVGASAAHDAYNNLALLVTYGPGQGTAFKITGFDYSAPRQWAPNRSYTLPDTWMDHVGDPAHGSWAAADRKRYFVERDPAGIVGRGSSVAAFPALLVAGRGLNGTAAAAHAAGRMCLWRELSAHAYRLESYSGEVDLSLEDVAAEIARKAGVLRVRGKKRLAGQVALSHGGWDLAGDLALTRQACWTGVLRLKVVSGYEVGISNYNPTGTLTKGSIVTVSSGAVKLYGFEEDGSFAVAESLPLEGRPAGWITFSVRPETVSVWVNGRLRGAFAHASGLGWGIVANDGAVVEVDWPELDLRVDSFVLDAGASGMALMERLLNQKRIFLRDDPQGCLELFRSRDELPGEYTLMTDWNVGRANTELFTRLRLTGAEVVEAADLAAVRQYGNLFALRNMEELSDAWQFEDEAGRALADALATTEIITLSGAADPRLEVDDILTAAHPDETRRIIVDRLALRMNVAPDEAAFDMEVEGRCQAP